MKKLLMGSIVLTLFSISILIFQVSCQKEVVAQQQTTNYILPPATTTTLGGVIIGSGLSVTSNGTLSVTSTSSGGLQQLGLILAQPNFSDSLYIYNYSGQVIKTLNTQNITYSTNTKIMDAKISPDGKTLFIRVKKKIGNPAEESIYSMDMNNNSIFSKLASASDELKLLDVK